MNQNTYKTYYPQGPGHPRVVVESRWDNQRPQAVWRLYQLVYLLAAVLETLLGLRFLLKLFGANPATQFTSGLYNITQAFLRPFSGVFGNAATAPGAIWEWSTLLAMLVYALVAYILTRLIFLARPIRRQEAQAELSNINN